LIALPGMKMKSGLIVILVSALLGTTGCYTTETGQTKAGVPFLKDRIQSSYERPLNEVMKAARETIAFNGTLTSEDVLNKVLTGKVNTRTVYVKLDDSEPKLTKVTVQVRTKAGGSDIDLAAELDKQIALRLR
jgi:hypothetical protein